MSKNCGIYLIKNQTNRKVYVGSSKNIKSRIWHHKNCLKHNRHTNRYLQNAWNKYGENSFEVFKLEYCPIDQLFEREKWWMDLFQSYQDSYGYNIAEVTLNGGPGHSEETKALISEGRKKWHKENPDKSNSRPVKVIDFSTTPFSWKDFPAIKEACQYHNLPDEVTNNRIFRHIDKKAYNDLAFVTLDDTGGYERLKKMYLRWLKLNNKANHTSKPFYAYNLKTKQITEFSSRNQFKKLAGLGVSLTNLEKGHKRGDFIVGKDTSIIEQRLIG